LKEHFIRELRGELKGKWREQRSSIIAKSLIRQKEAKLKKVVFLHLLENIL